MQGCALIRPDGWTTLEFLSDMSIQGDLQKLDLISSLKGAKRRCSRITETTDLVIKKL